jgi:alkylation response protein AidB-like acyl-CoA dehydrogenase
MRPVGRELDLPDDPEDVIAEGAVLWDVFAKQRELGLHDIESATAEMSPLERVQEGQPIIEHQSVKARIFRMFTRMEAGRSLARRVVLYNTPNPPRLLQYSIASKVFATTAAFEVASDALQIYGGNRLSLEYPIEKIMRDARASMIEEGCNDMLSLAGASRL